MICLVGNDVPNIHLYDAPVAEVSHVNVVVVLDPGKVVTVTPADGVCRLNEFKGLFATVTLQYHALYNPALLSIQNA